MDKSDESGSKKTKEDDEVVTKVEFPEAPTTEAILEAAEKFYNFVNTK